MASIGRMQGRATSIGNLSARAGGKVRVRVRVRVRARVRVRVRV